MKAFRSAACEGIPAEFRPAFEFAARWLDHGERPGPGLALVVGRGIEGLALCGALRGEGAIGDGLVRFLCPTKKLARTFRARGEGHNAREIERVARQGVLVVAFQGEAFYAAPAVFLNASGGDA